MRQPKFTHGPWSIIGDEHKGLIIHNGLFVVATVASHNIANARLISAAPDMHALLCFVHESLTAERTLASFELHDPYRTIIFDIESITKKIREG